ncbi:MAG: FAD-binding protein [Myxococcota bacterium]|nr:FAD-binding protein [Myxococcota bacterium]
MRRLARVPDSARLRARRWDAIVVGSGIAALTAATRIGSSGQRVLVVEEDAARGLHPALREPFFLAGSRDGGILDACVRELSIPLLDRRRLGPERLAYQVTGPELRLDVGAADITGEELARWGLCSRADAAGMMRALAEATEAERKAMLTSPLVRVGRRLGLGRAGATGSHFRGLPEEVSRPDARLGPILDAQVSALSNLASDDVTPEARVRLLGCALSGGVGFGDGPPWLSGLLRKRVEDVHGEFRSVARGFNLVSVDNRPGVLVEDTEEVWLGRSLVVAAAPGALRPVLNPEDTPDFLAVDRPLCRRIGLHLQIDRDVLPRGMCPRVISLGNGAKAAPGGPFSGRVASITAYANPNSTSHFDLIARMRLSPGESSEAVEDELESRVRELMPFAGERIQRRPQRRPVWDDDGWLEDPAPGTGWPAELDIRALAKPSVYLMDRAATANLGLEGDLLLGWRSGDAIAKSLQ